jgi:hypothetical protein
MPDDQHDSDDALDNEPLDEEISKSEIAERPSETGDPGAVVDRMIPQDIREKYEVFSYRNAATILSQTRQDEFADLLLALRAFKVTTTMIRTAGGNESEIPKLVSTLLRPHGWMETAIKGDLVVRKTWREPSPKKDGEFVPRTNEIRRENFLDGHKIDYVKDRVAFDLEWNSKDQTFDRDLYAFSAFFQCGVIDVGVLVTRSTHLDEVLKKLGPALLKDGKTIDRKRSGEPRTTSQKYGASTTWMGKLLYRLNAGRNGGCPVLAIGITADCIEDWPPRVEP